MLRQLRHEEQKLTRQKKNATGKKKATMRASSAKRSGAYDPASAVSVPSTLLFDVASSSLGRKRRCRVENSKTAAVCGGNGYAGRTNEPIWNVGLKGMRDGSFDENIAAVQDCWGREWCSLVSIIEG